jgi:putative DNA primase/helicase
MTHEPYKVDDPRTRRGLMLFNGQCLASILREEGGGKYTRYYCSLPNVKGDGETRHLYLDDDDPAREQKLLNFLQREDRPGRAIYYCIGLLKYGSRERKAATVAALPCIVVDLDLKNITEAREEVIACLKRLALPPSEIRDSGNGLHAVWWFKEPATDEAGMAQAEALMKRMARLLAADPAPTHRAALLRVPGTHNSKAVQ